MFKVKRFLAFALDIWLVILLTNLITSVYYINPYMDDLEDTTKAYNEVLNDYQSMTTEDEIEEFLNNIQDKLYDVEHASIYIHVWYLIFSFLYFVVFAYFTGGQTLGKKLMGLKIVNEDNSKVKFMHLLMRMLTGGSNFLMGTNIACLASIILILTLRPGSTYIAIYMLIMVLSFLMEIANIIIYIKNKDNKCLNDYISASKVINV